MMHSVRTDSQLQVPANLAGKWVALTRDESRILGSGETFEEAKSVAEAAGESSVLLGRVGAIRHWWQWGQPLVYVVAVYISSQLA
jgi:hypothetical protein